MSNLYAAAADSRSITIVSACETLKRDIKNSKSSPTLQRISTNAIAISLWRKHDVKHEIFLYFLGTCIKYGTSVQNMIQFHEKVQIHAAQFQKRDEWQKIELEVQKHAENICLPNALKRKLYRAISMTGHEIREWLNCLVDYTWSNCKICKEFVNDIAWTGHGTIDKPRTVDLLLTKHGHTLGADGSLFSLACVLCLDQVIPTLWNLVPECTRRDVEFLTSFRRFVQTEATIFYFWIDYIEGKLKFDDAGCEYMLRHFKHDSVDALEYVWCRMSSAGRNRLLEEGIMGDRKMTFDLDVVYFYLSHATEEQLLSIIENDAMRLLDTLVLANRSWQEYFLSTIRDLCHLVSEDDIPMRLARVSSELLLYACFPTKVFQVLCDEFPGEMKKRFFTEDGIRFLFKPSGLEIFKIITRDENDECKFERIKLGISSCLVFVLSDREVEFGRFLGEIFVCEDWVKKVKKEFAAWGAENLVDLVRMDKYEMFFNWCFSTDEEMVEFRSVHFNYSVVVTKFRYCPIRIVKDFDKFCAWCLLSEDEMTRFKEMLQINENKIQTTLL